DRIVDHASRGRNPPTACVLGPRFDRSTGALRRSLAGWRRSHLVPYGQRQPLTLVSHACHSTSTSPHICIERPLRQPNTTTSATLRITPVKRAVMAPPPGPRMPPRSSQSLPCAATGRHSGAGDATHHVQFSLSRVPAACRGRRGGPQHLVITLSSSVQHL